MGANRFGEVKDGMYIPGDRITNAMNSILDRPIPSISLSLFESKYLALFNVQAFSEPNAPLMDWLEIADSPWNDVNVINDQTGEIEFVVPSLFSKDVDYFPSDDYRITNEIEQTFVETARMPQIGEAYLQRNVLEMINMKTDVESAKRWNEIFARYNLEKFVIREEDGTFTSLGVEASKDATSTKSSKDDGEWINDAQIENL